MANRPVYCSTDESPYYKAIDIEFEFFSGFSIQQKQRSIRSLHESFIKNYSEKKVLEVSRKSANLIGNRLSAFNLKYKYEGKFYPVECLFQGSKVFESGVVYQELYDGEPRAAKKDESLKSSGKIVGFKLFDKDFPSEPKDFFYNWLYINALVESKEVGKELLNYDSFTDIEFNPKKSINCQAIATAIYVGLYRNGLLEKALESSENFRTIVYGEKQEKLVQMSLFDLQGIYGSILY